MSVTIRNIEAEDAGDVARIYTQSSVHLRSIGDSNEFLFNAEVFVRDGFGENVAFKGIVALQEDRVAGYLLYGFGYDTDAISRYLLVIDLAVEESLRGHGIGKALMDEAASIAQRAGCARLNWWVHKNNKLAVDFYHALGATVYAGEVSYMTWKVRE